MVIVDNIILNNFFKTTAHISLTSPYHATLLTI